MKLCIQTGQAPVSVHGLEFTYFMERQITYKLMKLIKHLNSSSACMHGLAFTHFMEGQITYKRMKLNI